MKLIVTATGDTLEAAVDPRFGRAARFILYDTKTGAWEAVDNTQNLNALQGAGIQAAQAVARTGARAVITGDCGPKAFQTLHAAGIQVFAGAEGTVREAVAQFEAGALSLRRNADG